MKAGVDEAGRGPVLGPLVIAAVLVESEGPLRQLGVKDSKLLSPRKREELEPKIRAVAHRVETMVITPAELNRRMPKTNLNKIEAAAFAALLKRLRPTEAVIDACDVDAARFGRNVAARMRLPTCVLRSEHEADVNHPVVAAASIVAKVLRDKHVAALCAEHGDVGSGYPSDRKTQAFLEAWVKEKGMLPPFARHEWETSKRLVARPVATLASFGTPTPKKKRAS
ncbi:MAG: ribonuclease HII [Candidatus Thermoplasmatota archaeon]